MPRRKESPFRREACRQDHILHRGFRDIGYHFYITRDGEIHRGRALEKVGAHCRNHNAHSVGVCYEGGLDANGKPKDTRTLEQKRSFARFVEGVEKAVSESIDCGTPGLESNERMSVF